MKNHVCHEYLDFNSASFFTVILLPEKDGKFPTVIARCPYVDPQKTEQQTQAELEKIYAPWLSRGYAVVFQHCRGQGLSTGEFVPYIHEREDGLFLQDYVRRQSFYNGELYLYGGSYCASLHYATAPFAKDIKGAVLEVQDTERYRICYRNGQMRKGHANWHFTLYKRKSKLKKSFNPHSFSTFPLAGISERGLGEISPDFEGMLLAEREDHPYWNTRYGGNDARNAEKSSGIPILFAGGFNDFYVGGMFKMWCGLDEKTREKCAFLVSPYNHGDSYSPDRGLAFENGRRTERFGAQYAIDWLDSIRLGTPLAYEKGKITYYRSFENTWESDFYKKKTAPISLKLGTCEKSFDYDPENPVSYSAAGERQPSLENHPSVVSLTTAPLDSDVFVKGKMTASLLFSTNVPDTAVYVNISIRKPDGDYILRHDITSLSYQLGSYKENACVRLEFSFDEHAFLLKKGETLRVDIGSADDNVYTPHPNRKGPYYLIDNPQRAKSTVYLSDSTLTLPVEI